LVSAATDLLEDLGSDLFTDHNLFREKVEASLKHRKLKLSASDLKVFYKAVSWRDETAPEVVAKLHKAGKATVDPLYGFYEGKGGIIEYESDPDLRDTEQVPLQEDVETFMRREVLPYTPDAWIDASATKIGYEISFTRHFYKPQPLRSLEEIRADILALERETEGMLAEIVGGSK
jgi:type I restriction enzyme M protein